MAKIATEEEEGDRWKRALHSHNKYQGVNPLMILAVGEKRNHFQLYQSTLLFLTRATLRRN